MIEEIYQIYRTQRNLIDNADKAQTAEEKTFIAEIKVGVVILEESHPEYKERYERDQAMYRSFTNEQKDFICWQIGEWYLKMKPLLEGQHNLGYMKEVLKEMICGNE